MATRCQNCERTLGWMPRRLWSPTWRCGCGVTCYHAFQSFLEVWMRLAIVVGLAAGIIACFGLQARGMIPQTSPGRMTLIALGLAAIIAMGLFALSLPFATLSAYRIGVPCFLGDMIKAAATMIVLIGCAGLSAWMMMKALRDVAHEASGHMTPVMRELRDRSLPLPGDGRSERRFS